MSSPLKFAGLIFLAACVATAADSDSGGRLVNGCADRSVSPEFCQWVVRYRSKEAISGPGKDLRTAIVSQSLTKEQSAVAKSLGEYSPVQPAQIQGTRASVLVQKNSADYAVVSLEKRNGTWSITSVAEPLTVRH